MDFLLTELGVPPLVVAIVEFWKRYFDLPARQAPIAAVIAAATLYGLALLSGVLPDATYIEHGVRVLISFLSAAGLYSVGKSVAERNPDGPSDPEERQQ